jgi:Cu-Zn family superoxide dismutase
MRTGILIVAALALFGCSRNEPPSAAPAESAPPPETAAPAAATDQAESHHANLVPTRDNKANGVLELQQQGGAVLITGRIAGLTPDTEHGFHIHETGDCSAPDASSAGAHFNPTQQQHGNPQVPPHHAGDMLNLTSDAQGNADVNARVEGVTLGDGGPEDVMGKAVILHEKADDYTSQPSGDSGARIACGVIE